MMNFYWLYKFFLHFIIEPYLHTRVRTIKVKVYSEKMSLKTKRKLKRVWEKITMHVIIIILWKKLSGNCTPWVENNCTIMKFFIRTECVTVTILINVYNWNSTIYMEEKYFKSEVFELSQKYRRLLPPLSLKCLIIIFLINRCNGFFP